MDVQFLTGDAIAEAITDMLPRYEELHWAVAWGSDTKVAKRLGDFANRIEENDAYLARAMDSIPQKGEVGRHHYRP